ncbi:MAG: family 78 glycoside hydrolase catalytic domain [Clostridia bacterium]|nr:family 78 glycoside hydrolase catalytic domain [Clostridia bacterium]
MFENSRWIAKEDIKEVKPAPLFRKCFDINKDIKSATMHICGLGTACSYINGVPVSDEVLSTPFTKYDSRIVYNTYDVTELISKGTNSIGCILGNGCYFVTYWRWDYYRPDWVHHPKLLLELDIAYCDGTKEQIVSDTSWKTADSAVIYNETKRGEIFDARLWQPDWNMADYDDSNWGNAFICRSPGGILGPRTTPPIRVTRRFKGKYIGNNVYDIGQNISGWARITAVGERGTEIALRYSELLHEDGTIAPEQLNRIVGSDTHFDKYIMSGNGVESWAPSFAYHGFRYVEVTGAPEQFELEGEMINTDFDTVGEFVCSDEMLNRIHHASCMATLSNFVGLPTDCPHREQNAWTGDALISVDQTLMNYDAVSSYRKWMYDILDTQRPSGQICCIAPTGGWGYNWGSGPAWDSIYIYLPYYIYSCTGDMSIIQEFWDSMELYMQFMESMSLDDTVCFGLGDWCAPKGVDLCPTVITDISYFYQNNKIMARCAQLLGKDSTYYETRAHQIKEAFREKFIKPDKYLSDNTCAIACAIYQNLYTEDEKSDAARHLSEIISQKGCHIDCGILGMKYIFSALSEYGYADTVYRMCTNPEYPSYAYWINNGMTTLCETWDMKFSCNHHMYSEIDMWLYKHVAGIHIDEGAQHITVKPCFLQGLTYARAKHKDIEVCWDEEKITVTLPVNGTVVVDDKAKDLSPGTYTIMRKDLEVHQ